MIDLSQAVYAIGRNGPSGVQLLGTAFAVGANKIATAYHVVGGDDRDLVMIAPKIAHFSEYQDTADGRVNPLRLKIAAADPVRDLCVLQSDEFSLRFSYGLGSTDSSPPGTPIVTLGFPHANHGRLVLTQQNANVGARVLIENARQKNKHIILNTQAREGQSGGPVLSATMKEVVAILIGSYAPGGGGGISLGGVDPHTLHQTTHAVSAEYLRAML
ncbi:S1 family peptidase [Kribbella flavida]|uniref:S1 family peptidase n=1 Tax=Kribbella flavida TaxID=182640 RepID=UPI00192C5530|nr:serine protease [Kribbella flavida]